MPGLLLFSILTFFGTGTLVCCMCPAPAEIFPHCATFYDDTAFVRADACRGQTYNVSIEERQGRMVVEARQNRRRGQPADFNWDNRVTAMVVRQSCTLTGYDNTNFGGARREFTGVNWRMSRDGWSDRISSYECNCPFAQPSCNQPREEFQTLIVCDGRQSQGQGECSFSATTGFAISSTSGSSQTTSMSRSVAVTVGVEFLSFFSASATVSASTLSEITQDVSNTQGSSQSTTTEIRCQKEPGKLTRVERKTLICENFSYLTKQFRCVNKSFRCVNEE